MNKSQLILAYIETELPNIHEKSLEAIKYQLPLVIDYNKKLEGKQLRNSNRKFKNLLSMYVKQIVGGYERATIRHGKYELINEFPKMLGRLLKYQQAPYEINLGKTKLSYVERVLTEEM
ncbi:hypothetical protein [Periweissella fabalis]|uniref:Uncharacterized protein n=1 Tax=Periweissella fabalis TaxID=1070421 RepID=A0A7X6N2M8_9LACO|nr:hypothetical protein [Periweissella fabalis]MCM0599210.1 hypothetical protein [Periweissella fabalis]NKZ23489.1 hypothetical protein [Periweissella fabalis]